MKEREADKIGRYQDLAIEISGMWKRKTRVVLWWSELLVRSTGQTLAGATMSSSEKSKHRTADGPVWICEYIEKRNYTA